MIRTPSSERWRRSRSATSRTSPTPRPSTNVTPDSTWSTIAAPAVDSSTTEPFSASTIESAGTPASRASRAWAASIRNSPWTGMTRLRPHEGEHACAAPRRMPWPETWTGAFSWCSTSAPAFASWLIASWTRSSLPGTGFAEMITVSPALDRDRRDGRCRRSASAPTSARPGCRCRGSAPRAAGSSSSSFGRISASSGTLM